VVVDADAARIAELEAFVVLLLDKITVLESLVKGDSSNSSRPPSSDGGTAKNKRPIANGRKLNKGAKRSQGKQPGASDVLFHDSSGATKIIIRVVCRNAGGLFI